MSKRKFLTKFNMLDTRDLAGRLKPAIELTITRRLFPPAATFIRALHGVLHVTSFPGCFPVPVQNRHWIMLGRVKPLRIPYKMT